MSSLSEIQAMGSILQRKSRGRIWNNDIHSNLSNDEKIKHTKKKGHFKKHWDKDLWD